MLELTLPEYSWEHIKLTWVYKNKQLESVKRPGVMFDDCYYGKEYTTYEPSLEGAITYPWNDDVVTSDDNWSDRWETYVNWL